MAADSRKGEDEDSGEFADFMADISQEIAERVESLSAPPKAPAKTPPKAPPDATRGTPVPADGGLILEWENVADRMIEDMR
jgi:hypothetical protein